MGLFDFHQSPKKIFSQVVNKDSSIRKAINAPRLTISGSGSSRKSSIRTPVTSSKVSIGNEPVSVPIVQPTPPAPSLRKSFASKLWGLTTPGLTMNVADWVTNKFKTYGQNKVLDFQTGFNDFRVDFNQGLKTSAELSAEADLFSTTWLEKITGNVSPAEQDYQDLLNTNVAYETIIRETERLVPFQTQANALGINPLDVNTQGMSNTTKTLLIGGAIIAGLFIFTKR